MYPGWFSFLSAVLVLLLFYDLYVVSSSSSVLLPGGLLLLLSSGHGFFICWPNLFSMLLCSNSLCCCGYVTMSVDLCVGVGMDVYLLTAFCMCYVCCGYAWVSTSSNGVHYVCIKGSP